MQKIIFLSLLLFCFVIFADKKSYAVGPGENLWISGSQNKIAVIGDSYTAYFKDCNGEDEFEYFIFAFPALYKDYNKTLFTNLLTNGNHEYVLFSTGVNDYLLDTPLDTFEATMREYIKIVEERKKNLILHTYMHFPKDRVHPNPVSIEQYDSVFRKLADEFECVYYIDMSNFNHDRFCIDDGMHFDKLFYKTLYAKLKYLIDDINSTKYHRSNPWVSVLKNKKIAVVGDSYAGTFVRLEKDKSYEMEEFAKSGQTIIQNSDIINAGILSDAKYVLISTSVNDYEKQTTLADFEDKLREFINNACIRHKIVFMHTYMEYGAAKANNIVIKSYDEIIRKLVEEYPITIYIDAMMFQDVFYQMADKTHYGVEFNDYLYNTIDTFIKAIEGLNQEN